MHGWTAPLTAALLAPPLGRHSHAQAAAHLQHGSAAFSSWLQMITVVALYNAAVRHMQRQQYVQG